MSDFDWAQIFKMLAAMLFVLGLMGGLALVLRYVTARGLPGLKPARRRLRITETLQIDMRTRAVLLSRDEKEHLVILSSSGHTVVEANIEPETRAQSSADLPAA